MKLILGLALLRLPPVAAGAAVRLDDAVTRDLERDPRTHWRGSIAGPMQVGSVIASVGEPSVPPGPRITASSLAELLAEFQMPGQPLHGLDLEDAERVLVEVVEQLVLNAMRQRKGRTARN